MEGNPKWLYPGRTLDRSIRARVGRFSKRFADRFDRGLPTLLRLVRETAAASKRTPIAAARDMVDTWSRHSIRPHMFAGQMLWAVDPRRRGEFVRGVELDAFLRATLDPDDRALLQDKARFSEHCRRNGIPSISTLAVVGGTEPPASCDVPHFTRRDEFHAELARIGGGRELFLKPAIGKHGLGVYRVAADGRAFDTAGAALSVAALTADVFDYRHPAGDHGYILQPFVASGGAMQDLIGVPELATLRVITATRGARVAVLRAFVKLPAAGRLTNNFLGGSTGTLLSDVEVETGRLGPIVGVMRPGFRFAVESSDAHPFSRRVLRGQLLPGWPQARSIAERGAGLHSKTSTLGWDLAYGPDGWVVLEANTMWGAGGAQTAGRRGLRPDLQGWFPDHWN